MPKEIIRSEIGPFHVEIGWQKDQDVQIGTIVQEIPLAELVTGWDDELKATGRGLFCTLSRGEINELIRVLRRARDQAFGRDE